MASTKLGDVTRLINKLKDDLDKANLSQSERDSTLEQLKIHGRDPTNADPIFTPAGFETLAKHAFESETRSTARGALRVMANAMLLKPATRQILVDLPYNGTACSQLQSEGPKSWDDSFLLARVLLLATYAPRVDLSALLLEHDLAEGIIANLARHTEVMSQPSHNPKADMMEEMAFNEVLRLLFNVTYHCPQQKSLFTPAIPLIVALLWKHEVDPKRPLDPPFSSLTNALLNLDLEDDRVRDSLCPDAAGTEPNRVAAKLIQLLEPSFKDKTHNDSELEQLATPVVGVLLSLYSVATDGVKEYLRQRLLPTEQDRDQALGRGTSLAAGLLRTTNNPMTPRLGEIASQLLFAMSDKDPSKFTENVGFGYASGFLARNNIPTPQNVGNTSNSSSSRPVNPITGQFIDAESHPDLPEMTEDEKLREAERLFVLFERLKKTGIVDIQNPVEQAMRSGRFQEMDDNRVTELDSDDDKEA